MLSYHIGKHVVHKCLEYRWGIAETEEHYCGFKEPKGGDEHSLPLVRFMDSNVIVPPAGVGFGEKGGVFHVVDEFWDKR